MFEKLFNRKNKSKKIKQKTDEEKKLIKIAFDISQEITHELDFMIDGFDEWDQKITQLLITKIKKSYYLMKQENEK